LFVPNVRVIVIGLTTPTKIPIPFELPMVSNSLSHMYLQKEIVFVIENKRLAFLTMQLVPSQYHFSIFKLLEFVYSSFWGRRWHLANQLSN
jgi:hypothetical protein